jgi:sugar lactone lactonase YvrE
MGRIDQGAGAGAKHSIGLLMGIAMTVRFERVLQGPFLLGESPVWWGGLLWFVDITGRRLHSYDPASGLHRQGDLDEDIGCVAPAVGGGFVAGLRSGLWLLDPSGIKLRKLADNPEDQASSRFNDGRVDPLGRFLAGTIDEPRAGGKAGLYRYDRRGLVRLQDGLLTSNGLAFSPDGRTLYHSDTPRFAIYRYDYDPMTGQAENRRLFARLDRTETGPGRPDGAAVDSEGCYWSAMFEGARVHRYDPDGMLMASYPVPALKPTMPAFGGDDLKTLYVTTAGDGIYALPTDIAGLPALCFDPER